AFWSGNQKLYRATWIIFWSLNILAAVGLSLTFTKKDRIAPLYYLYNRGDVAAVLLEGPSVKQPPVYYMGKNAVDYDEFVLGEMGMNRMLKNKENLDPNLQFVF